MFRLLALVATALAAPQLVPYYTPVVYPQYAGYSPMGLYGYPRSPAIYGPPAYGVPVVQPGTGNTRAFFGAGALQEINGRMVEQTAATTGATPPTTTATQEITGTVQLTQNALTNLLYNNDAQYKIYVQRSVNDLTGQNVIVAIGDDCLTVAPTGQTPDRRLATVNVPAQFNGFYLSGATTGFNLDGMNGKTDLTANPRRLQILNAAGTAILGCTEMDLM